MSGGLPEGCLHLGYVSDSQVPLVINALDAMVVLRRPCENGDHSYPVKLYEAARCGVPVVATNVRGSRWILREYPEDLLLENTAVCLAESIERALQIGRKNYDKLLNDWSVSTDCFLNAINEVKIRSL